MYAYICQTQAWIIAEASTGIVLRISIYIGRGTDFDSSNEELETVGTYLGERVVFGLSRPYHNKGHHIFMDNFFNSPQLLEGLLRQRTYGCGTLRLTLKDMPEEYHGKNKKKVKKGDTAVHQRGNIVLTVWHDKRPVAILSSNVSPGTTTVVTRRTKEPPHQKQVTVPTQVHIYNNYMGGVDLSDQLRQYYPTGRTSKKWWKYIFWYCLDTCISNAYLLASKHLPADKSTKWKRDRLLGFMMDLGKELIGDFSSRQRQQVGLRTKKRSFQPQTTVHHQRVKFEGRKRACIGCKQLGRLSKDGEGKRTSETTYGCNTCGVNYCLECFQAHLPSSTAQTEDRMEL